MRHTRSRMINNASANEVCLSFWRCLKKRTGIPATTATAIAEGIRRGGVRDCDVSLINRDVSLCDTDCSNHTTIKKTSCEIVLGSDSIRGS